MLGTAGLEMRLGSSFSGAVSAAESAAVSANWYVLMRRWCGAGVLDA